MREYARMMARHNRIANERLLEKCGLLRRTDYRRARMKDFSSGRFAYTNNKGLEYVEAARVAVCHFFNHQTHHRGQIHALLTQSGVAGPSMDLHRIVNP